MKKLIVVTDPSGKIIATQEPHVHVPSGGVASKASLVAQPGQHLHEVEVPPDLDGVALHELHERAHVDTSGKHPRLVQRK